MQALAPEHQENSSKRLIIIILGLIFFLLFSARAIQACSCVARLPPCQAYKETQAIFIATVIEIKTGAGDAAKSGNITSQMAYARLSVLETFKGISEKEIRMWQGTGSGDCSFVFEQGESYLIYASFDEETKLHHTNICTRSRPLAYAADDLDYLRGQPASDSVTRLSGTLIRLDYSEEGVKEQPPELLSGIKVAAVNEQGQRFEAITDGNGFYKITGLPAGLYKVWPELPSHLSLAYGSKDKFEITDKGCAAADFMTRTDGRISGLVIDSDGRPVPNTIIDLIPASTAGRIGDPRVGRYKEADVNGRFEFTELTPGEYLLGVNIRQAPSGERPFRRTYFPDADSPSRSQVITLDNGEKLKGIVLRLPPRLRVRAIEGTLVWPDGRPVTKALVVFRDTPSPTGGRSLGMANVDEQGRFSISALEGQEGWIHSTILVPVKDGLQAIMAGPVRAVAISNQKKIRLVAGKKTGGVKILP